MVRAFILLLLALPASAAEDPACGPPRAGVLACLAGRLCECRFERGGSLTGQPAGYRWHCGILRPSCGEAPAPPYPTPLPDLLLQLPPATLPPSSPWPR